MSSPLDYSLCRQTVTVYRLEGDQVRRQVLTGVLYRYEVSLQTDEQGCVHRIRSLLIAPGQAPLQPGDRIYDGVGPELTAQQWSRFLPVSVPGLSQLQYVKPCYWGDRLCHTEAGSL